MGFCSIPEASEDTMHIRRFFPLVLLATHFIFLIWGGRGLCAQDLIATISEIKFTGNRSIPSDQLKSVLQRVREGRPYWAGRSTADIKRVKDVYLAEGFLNVEVGPEEAEIRGEGEARMAVITIPVKEGARYRAGKIEVRNVQALSSKTLMQLCPLKEGDPYDRNKIAEWREVIENAYRAMGHIRILCTSREERIESGKIIHCAVECDEGRSYTIGKITIVGDESVDPLEFKRKLLFGEGRLFVPEMLSTSIYYLNRMKIYKPISYSDVQMQIHEEEGTVDLGFHVFLAEQEKRDSE
jgi:outer membrane protein insertion porin family